MIKYKWKIAYWDLEKELVFCYDSDHYKWEKCPKKNVIFVYVSKWGDYPFMNPNNEYKTTLKGRDFYFLKEVKGVLYYGGWNSPKKGRTTTDAPGSLYKFSEGSKIEKISITKKPKEIRHYKEGIWVEEPWASTLGLGEKVIEKSARPRNCCD